MLVLGLACEDILAVPCGGISDFLCQTRPAQTVWIARMMSDPEYTRLRRQMKQEGVDRVSDIFAASTSEWTPMSMKNLVCVL